MLSCRSQNKARMLPYKALTDFLFTQTETVYYAVRTKCLDKIRVNFLERIKPICLVYNVQRGLSFVLYSKPLTLQPWVPIPLRACICLYRFLTLYIVHKRLTTGWTIRDRIPMSMHMSVPFSDPIHSPQATDYGMDDPGSNPDEHAYVCTVFWPYT